MPPSLSPCLSPKLRGFCKYAAKLGFEWVWVDTCCIDKRNSQEVAEGINSMSRWYANASVCIVYLEDATDSATLARSRWFRRGWTLQELIAPRELEFVSRDWTPLGDKTSLAGALEKITGVDADVLTFRRRVSEACVAERMSWAAGRETTRPEDRACSLLGLFDVHMQVIYGEGAHAFRRLQEELLQRSPDQTLFAWGLAPQLSAAPLQHGLFAGDPSCFGKGLELKRMSLLKLEHLPTAAMHFRASMRPRANGLRPATAHHPTTPPIRIATPEFRTTGYGVRARLPLIRSRDETNPHAIAVLAVQYRSSAVGLALRRTSPLAAADAHYVVNAQPRIVLVGCDGEPSPDGWVPHLGLDRGDLHVAWEDVYIGAPGPLSRKTRSVTRRTGHTVGASSKSLRRLGKYRDALRAARAKHATPPALFYARLMCEWVDVLEKSGSRSREQISGARGRVVDLWGAAAGSGTGTACLT